MNYLFMLDEKFDDMTAGVFSSLMPKERRDFYISCKSPLRKRQTVCAYLLLSYGLYNGFGIDDIRPKLVYSQSGKPYLRDFSNVYFSLSHSENYILCSLSYSEIGADIQCGKGEEVRRFSAGESVYKFGKTDGGESNTCQIENEDYIISISRQEKVDEEILRVSFDELISFINCRTDLSKYIDLNSKITNSSLQTPLSMLKEQILRHPNRIAAVYKDQRISYKELDERSDRLANYLISRGVKRGDAVLLSVRAGVEFPISQWAIIKAGGCYAPLSDRWPSERVEFIIKNSGAKLMLADKNSPFANCNIEKVVYCEDCGETAESSPTIADVADDPFYMIYTSGSTGEPKGVMVSRGNLAVFSQNVFGSYYQTVIADGDELLSGESGQYGIKVGCICPLSFDMSVGENTTTLLNGQTVVFSDEDDQKPNNFSSFIISNSITVLWATPSKFKMYLKSKNCRLGLMHLKRVVLAGEAMDLETVKLSREYSFKLFNTYGPTETAIISTFYPVCKERDYLDSDIPIGKPFTDEICYVVDDEGELCECGERGELFIGGGCVALGYKNKPEQTGEKFIQNPFGTGKVYKTGDIVALDENNNLRFYGRVDNQVKVNGFRVELEEVESLILQQTGVKTVVAYKSGRLIAVVEEGSKLNLPDLRDRLPDYMLPVICYSVEKFPLNSNGKIDRGAISAFVEKHTSKAAYCPPKTDIQKKILRCFESVLTYSPIGTLDSFYEIGGDSIAALRISSLLEDEDINLSMYDILGLKTVKALSEKLEKDMCCSRLIAPSDLPINEFAGKGKHISKDELLKYIDNFENALIEKEYTPLKTHRDILISDNGYNRKIFKLSEEITPQRAKKIIREFVRTNPAFRTKYDRNANKCLQIPYKNDWYVPFLKTNKINFEFLSEMKNAGLRGGIQYLSYIFVIEDNSGSLFIATALNWAFTDRKSENLIYTKLLSLLNFEAKVQPSDFGPYEYAEKVREMKGKFLLDLPKGVRSVIDRFSVLSADEKLDFYLRSGDFNKYICRANLSSRLALDFYSSPIDFLAKIFAGLLVREIGISEIPIYLVDQNRNPQNEQLINSVIDFIPLVISPEGENYYSLVREILSHKGEGDMLIENESWDNSSTLLPFLNFLPSYGEGRKSKLDISEFGSVIVESVPGGSAKQAISLSSFIEDGKLVLVFTLPTEKQKLEKYINDIFNESD